MDRKKKLEIEMSYLERDYQQLVETLEEAPNSPFFAERLKTFEDALLRKRAEYHDEIKTQ